MNFSPIPVMDIKNSQPQAVVTFMFTGENLGFFPMSIVMAAGRAREAAEIEFMSHKMMTYIVDYYNLDINKCLTPEIIRSPLMAPYFAFDYMGSIYEVAADLLRSGRFGTSERLNDFMNRCIIE